MYLFLLEAKMLEILLDLLAGIQAIGTGTADLK